MLYFVSFSATLTTSKLLNSASIDAAADISSYDFDTPTEPSAVPEEETEEENVIFVNVKFCFVLRYVNNFKIAESVVEQIDGIRKLIG